MRLEEAIGRDPEIMSGELCFIGTRVPVKNLFDHLEAEGSLKDFFEGFPRVSRSQVEAVLEGSYSSLATGFDGRRAA